MPKFLNCVNLVGLTHFSHFHHLYLGCARNIIVAERVVLNFMQRMSGIATMTKVIGDLS